MPGSLRTDNVGTLLRTGARNFHLVRYLMSQALQSMDDRLNALREFYPRARRQDWKLQQAGIRVQTLKKANRGAIYFGTEVYSAEGGTLAALLGASPGASVSVNIALQVVRTCRPHLLDSPAGRARMHAMIPTYDEDLKRAGNSALFERLNAQAGER